MEEFKSKTLGFVYHVPFWEENGEVWTCFAPIGRYVEALANHFNQVTLITPIRNQEQQPLYRVNAANLKIITVKPLANVQSYYGHIFHFYARCFKAMKNIDILNIRMPTLIGFPAFVAARLRRKPVFLVVVGENLEVIKLAGYSGLKHLAARFIGGFQDWLMKQVIKKCPTFTNGEDLFNKYRGLNKNVYLMRSSTIHQADILPAFRDTCQSAPYRILTVAVVMPHKGTSLIPETIAQLRDSGIQVTWKYVGNIEGNSGQMELEKTKKLAQDLNVQQYLTFESPMGFDELLPLYRESDLFVLPTYMEGVPRVILEAQASGLPVITTRVGGIPGAVQDGVDAIMIHPGDVIELANAIQRVILDIDLRVNLIKNGIIKAKKNTIEAETVRMLERVQALLGG